jgi:hypothetical protein
MASMEHGVHRLINQYVARVFDGAARIHSTEGVSP